MNKLVSASLALAFVLLSQGCDFVMAPDIDGDRASLALTMAKVPGESLRAAIQGPGYLYIRTIGGPTGTSGPLYGPYKVTSGVMFKTNDIPPGHYDLVTFLHSGKELFTSATYTVEGQQKTFRDIMLMDDPDMTEFIMDDASTRFQTAKDELSAFFESQTCLGTIKDASLPANRTTVVTVTLRPITEATSISLGSTGSVSLVSLDAVRRVFFAIHGSGSTKLPLSTETITCTLTETVAGAELGIVAFYDDFGKLIPSTRTGTSLSSGGYTWTLSAADLGTAVATGQIKMYLYAEYKGNITGIFANSLPPP